MEGSSEVYHLSLQPNDTSQAGCIVTYEIKDSIRLLDYNVGGAAFGMSQEVTREYQSD